MGTTEGHRSMHVEAAALLRKGEKAERVLKTLGNNGRNEGLQHSMHGR